MHRPTGEEVASCSTKDRRVVLLGEAVTLTMGGPALKQRGLKTSQRQGFSLIGLFGKLDRNRSGDKSHKAVLQGIFCSEAFTIQISSSYI